MDYEKNIEIPFGAHDSELKGWEYTIPEGMEAIIKDGKVIVREKASEDEEIRKWLIDYFNDYYDRSGDTFCGMQITRILDYLEKQKEQKPLEWSEEDEKIIQSLILAVNKYVFFAGIETNKIVSFLKSLRPSWKPSEEQMQYLLAVINDPNNAGAESCHLTLKSIYNDLKKL